MGRVQFGRLSSFNGGVSDVRVTLLPTGTGVSKPDIL
jgi:hypothetical protein